MIKKTMRLLTREDIESLITIDEVIEIMRDLFGSIAEGKLFLPERVVVECVNKKDSVLFMPGYIPEKGGLGIKIVSVFPTNKSRNIPTTTGQLILNDPETGKIIAIMEAGLITALRTAAVSAVATDLLALKDANSLGLFGAGIQGRYHIHAISRVRPIENIFIYDTDRQKAEDLASHIESSIEKLSTINVADRPKDVVTRSKIIITATTARSPVFKGSDILPQTHINAIGSFKPDVRELDDETVLRSIIYVDNRDSVLTEAGDLIIPIKSGLISPDCIRSDLSELIKDKGRGRNNEDDITLFKSVGLAVEDIAVGINILKRAEKRKTGLIF